MDHYETDTEGNWNDWTFQQDSASSHASVNENKEKFKVPTQTCLLEADGNVEEHNPVESLKNAISEAFEILSMEVINQAVDNWIKRLDAIIKAKGGHFE
uniref:Uncharacterized protein n=1 Tax=Acrobeloides nanus TaxID=290746 RepID=A0A914DXF6_9BILA